MRRTVDTGAERRCGPANQRGRPRSHAVDRAILAATLDVVAERGVRDASIDEIAARAHAGKDTIYRRWAHKDALVRAALTTLDDTIHAPTGGPLHERLGHYVEALVAALDGTPLGGIMPSLVAEAVHDTGIADWLEGFWSRHRDALGDIARDGVERGEVTADVARAVPDALLGAVLARPLFAATRGRPHAASEVVAGLLAAGASPGASARDRHRP